MKLQLPKGTRDFKPEQLIVRNRIVDTLKKIFEQYGYSPLDTPLFERFDILASKYAGGAEILKETFKFKDQGKRDLALRYDLTVPTCRFVGMNPTMKLPFKRYQIGEVFRDGPVESARYRQFTQCDVDVVGCRSVTAEAELITIINQFFKSLKLDFIVRVNNRKLLNDILTYCKVPKNKAVDVILSIDKLDKIGFDGVKKELKEKGIDNKTIKLIEKLITIKGTNSEKIKKLTNEIRKSEGLLEIEKIEKILKKQKIDFSFDISLARGLTYYTGTVIEVILKNSKVRSSVCGGGRYDKMIGDFLGRGDYPAVGISFGLDRVYDAYIEKNKDGLKTVTQLLIIPIGTFDESFRLAEKLRSEGLKVEIDLTGKGPSKNLKYANSLKIPYVLFVGEDEIKTKKYKLKDMVSGEERVLSLTEISDFLSKN